MIAGQAVSRPQGGNVTEEGRVAVWGEEMMPRPGDVLVSYRSSTVDYDIRIVPNLPHDVCADHLAAVHRGRRVAVERQVDLWLTVDHDHFVRLESYREGSGS